MALTSIVIRGGGVAREQMYCTSIRILLAPSKSKESRP